MSIEVSGPDGSSFSFPDGTPHETINGVLGQHYGGGSAAPTQPTEQPLSLGGRLLDLAKSAGTGLGKGIIGLAGLPGDVASMFPESLRDEAKQRLPTSADIQGNVEKVTGPFHKPETTLGEYAQTGAEFLPALIGGPETIGAKLATRVALPAIASEAAGQLTKGTAAEPYARLAGAVTGAAAPGILGRAISPVRIAPERRAAVQTLENEGVQLSAGDATGSKALQYAENELGDALGAGGKATKARERVLEQYTSAALRRIGEDSPRATPEVIDSARKRIGGYFDDVTSRNDAIIDPQFATKAKQAVTDYINVTGRNSPLLQSSIEELSNAATWKPSGIGVLPGVAFQAKRSELGRYLRSTSDPALKSGILDLQHAMDDMLQRSLTKAGNSQDLLLWQKARGQYKNLLAIERGVTGASEASANGLITPAALRQAAVAQGRSAYARGQGAFGQLARAGEQVLKPLPQSGTAPRQAARLPAYLAGAALGHMAFGPAALATLATPALAGRLLMSGPAQAYLRNQAGVPLSNLVTRQNLARAALMAQPRLQLENQNGQ